MRDATTDPGRFVLAERQLVRFGSVGPAQTARFCTQAEDGVIGITLVTGRNGTGKSTFSDGGLLIRATSSRGNGRLGGASGSHNRSATRFVLGCQAKDEDVEAMGAEEFERACLRPATPGSDQYGACIDTYLNGYGEVFSHGEVWVVRDRTGRAPQRRLDTPDAIYYLTCKGELPVSEVERAMAERHPKAALAKAGAKAHESRGAYLDALGVELGLVPGASPILDMLYTGETPGNLWEVFRSFVWDAPDSVAAEADNFIHGYARMLQIRDQMACYRELERRLRPAMEREQGYSDSSSKKRALASLTSGGDGSQLEAWWSRREAERAAADASRQRSLVTRARSEEQEAKGAESEARDRAAKAEELYVQKLDGRAQALKGQIESADLRAGQRREAHGALASQVAKGDGEVGFEVPLDRGPFEREKSRALEMLREADDRQREASDRHAVESPAIQAEHARAVADADGRLARAVSAADAARDAGEAAADEALEKERERAAGHAARAAEARAGLEQERAAFKEQKEAIGRQRDAQTSEALKERDHAKRLADQWESEQGGAVKEGRDSGRRAAQGAAAESGSAIALDHDREVEESRREADCAKAAADEACEASLEQADRRHRAAAEAEEARHSEAVSREGSRHAAARAPLADAADRARSVRDSALEERDHAGALVAELSAKRSNMDPALDDIRNEAARLLGRDPASLVFVGELADVDDEWRELAETLLAPELRSLFVAPEDVGPVVQALAAADPGRQVSVVAAPEPDGTGPEPGGVACHLSLDPESGLSPSLATWLRSVDWSLGPDGPRRSDTAGTGRDTGGAAPRSFAGLSHDPHSHVIGLDNARRLERAEARLRAAQAALDRAEESLDAASAALEAEDSLHASETGKESQRHTDQVARDLRAQREEREEAQAERSRSLEAAEARHAATVRSADARRSARQRSLDSWLAAALQAISACADALLGSLASAAGERRRKADALCDRRVDAAGRRHAEALERIAGPHEQKVADLSATARSEERESESIAETAAAAHADALARASKDREAAVSAARSAAAEERAAAADARNAALQALTDELVAAQARRAAVAPKAEPFRWRTFEDVDYPSAEREASRLRAELEALLDDPESRRVEREHTEAKAALEEAIRLSATRSDEARRLSDGLSELERRAEDARSRAGALSHVAVPGEAAALLEATCAHSSTLQEASGAIAEQVNAYDAELACERRKISAAFESANRYCSEKGLSLGGTGTDPDNEAVWEGQRYAYGQCRDKLANYEERDLMSNLSEVLSPATSLIEQADSYIESCMAKVARINAKLRGCEYEPGYHIELDLQELNTDDARRLAAHLGDVQTVVRKCQKARRAPNQRELALVKRCHDHLKDALESYRAGRKRSPLDPRARLKVDFSVTDGTTAKDTDGASGGEGQKISVFVLAAALALRLPETARGNPRYSTIVLDEALNNCDDENIEICVSTLQQLGYQLVVICPDKNADSFSSRVRVMNTCLKSPATGDRTVVRTKEVSPCTGT